MTMRSRSTMTSPTTGIRSPSESERHATLETPLGVLVITCTEAGISRVRPATLMTASQEKHALPVFPLSATTEQAPMTSFDLRGLSAFAIAVLQETARIPRGEVRTYQQIACSLGRPTAIRAVGSALRRNPVPYLIPCHRVVRTDGTLGAYSLGGTSAKQHLLEAEGVFLSQGGIRWS